MNVESTLGRLLEIGRSERFAEITERSDFQDRSSVLDLLGVYRDDIVSLLGTCILPEDRDVFYSFVSRLSQDDQVTFIKSVAMVEHGVGGLFSATNLQLLFPTFDAPESTALDWVLRNTNCYSYFSREARSAEEYYLYEKRFAEGRALKLKEEEARQAAHKARIAAEATRKLYNAVRRGDIKAVRALVKQGRT